MNQINLMYHDIYSHDISESGFQRKRDLPYKLTAESFEEHVMEISMLSKKIYIPLNSVVFTFDDGGKSFYSVAAPILEKYGYKGIFFISTQYLGTDTFLNEKEVLKLHQSGHIIGSHAHSHKHLYELSDKQHDEEWKTSIEILSNIINEPILHASIPNGDLSKRVLSTTSKYGIKHLYTSDPTTKVGLFREMKIYGRYVILSNSTIKQIKAIITQPFVRFKLLLKRNLLKLIKTLLGDKYLILKNILFD